MLQLKLAELPLPDEPVELRHVEKDDYATAGEVTAQQRRTVLYLFAG